MTKHPFAVAATDQQTLLTFATLHLVAEAQVEVPRVGQVLVRHAADRRPLVLSPLHWTVLRQFEGGRTTASVLKQIIHGRNCVPLSDFYELVLKAHRHGLLQERASEVDANKSVAGAVWRASVSGEKIQQAALVCMATLMVALFWHPLETPGHLAWWLLGWLLTAGATSAGYALGASVLHGAGLEVHSPRFVRRSWLPRFEADLSDAEIAPPQVAIHVALARLTPPLLLAALAAAFVPGLALPLVAGLLYALAPIGRSPLLDLLRALHHEPRVAVEHDFLFECNRTPARLLRSWFHPGELRYAALRIGYAIIWTLLVGLACAVTTDTDGRVWWNDFQELDMPVRIGVVALGLLALGFAGLVVAGIVRFVSKTRARLRAAAEARAAAAARTAPPLPDEGACFDFLCKTHPFELLPIVERRELARAIQADVFATGDLLVAADDADASLQFIYAGSAALKAGPLARHRDELRPGDLFGEEALLRGGSQPADVRATSPGVRLRIRGEDYERLVKPFLPAKQMENAAEKIWLLRQVPLTRHWPAALRASLARRAVVQSFDRRTTVLERGRENTLFFLILDGELRALRDGRVLGHLRRGDMFGEISLLQNSLTQADIVGHRPGRFLCISKPDFLTFLTQDPKIALQIEGIASARLGHSVFSAPGSPLRRRH